LSPESAKELQARVRVALPLIMTFFAIGILLLAAGIYQWGIFGRASLLVRIIPGEVLLAMVFIPIAWVVVFVWRVPKIRGLPQPDSPQDRTTEPK
jgi:hypothetical protein